MSVPVPVTVPPLIVNAPIDAESVPIRSVPPLIVYGQGVITAGEVGPVGPVG